MANSLVDLTQIAFGSLSFLLRRSTILNAVWMDNANAALAAETGEVISVRTPPSNITASAYNGTSFTSQDITEGKIDLTLTEDVIVPVQWSTREDAASFSDIQQIIIEPAMDTLLRNVEAKVELDLTTDLLATGINEVGGGGVYGNTMTLDDIAAARELLNANDVTPLNRSLFPSAKDARGLIGLTTITDRSSSGEGTLQSGSLGTIYGFDVIESNAIRTDTAPAPDETYNLAIQREAFMIGMRALPMPKSPGVEQAVASHEGVTITVTKQWDVQAQSNVIVFRVLFGVKTLDVSRAVIIRG